VENTIYSTTNSDASDESEYEMMMPPVTMVDYSAYYRNLFPELRISYNVEYDNSDADTKPVSYKKKNISQMGRKKANRAQNGTLIIYICLRVYQIKMLHVNTIMDVGLIILER